MKINLPERAVVYAIGDVHGLAGALRELHERIFEDHALRFSDRPVCIIHLGDYIDRGPDSQGVINTVMALEERARSEDRLTVFSLMGNHEEMLLKAISGDPAFLEVWMRNGGDTTLESYVTERRDEDDVLNFFSVPHREWLSELPKILIDESRRQVFVHAGVNPVAFPDDDENVYLWTRSPRFFDPSRWKKYPALAGYMVIHGHTPTRNHKPRIAGKGQRINVDTGAVYGGPLTAVCLAEGEELSFLYSDKISPQESY
jgi:serine/threonine protein phosphatase 1